MDSYPAASIHQGSMLGLSQCEWDCRNIALEGGRSLDVLAKLRGLVDMPDLVEYDKAVAEIGMVLNSIITCVDDVQDGRLGDE